MLDKYCVSCHNATDWAGGVAFDTLELDAVASDAEIWENTIRKLRGALMPPPGKITRARSRRRRWCAGSRARSTPPPRRIRIPATWACIGSIVANTRTRSHDLLGLDVNPEALLPRDDAHDGFDNIASALQVSPSFLDQYIAAAQTVSVEALGNTKARPAATNYFVTDAGTQQRHRDGLPFGTRGGTVVEHFFPPTANIR